MSEITHFSCEYSRTSRSSCKKCFVPIVQNELRIGTWKKSSLFDGILFIIIDNNTNT
jgi:hypothetical protein